MKASAQRLFPVLLILISLVSLPAQTVPEIIKLEAAASYYGAEFDGKTTASGERFDMKALTAAHKTLPFGTILEVTNLSNGKRVTVRVNDRGPFVGNREIDLSWGAAERIGMLETGIAKVSIRKVGMASGAETAGAETPGRQAAPSGQTWIIQLGSFASEDNAVRFSETLRGHGFDPSLEPAARTVRVIIAGLTESELPAVKERLIAKGFRDFLVRREQR